MPIDEEVGVRHLEHVFSDLSRCSASVDTNHVFTTYSREPRINLFPDSPSRLPILPSWQRRKPGVHGPHHAVLDIAFHPQPVRLCLYRYPGNRCLIHNVSRPRLLVTARRCMGNSKITRRLLTP